MPIFSAAGAQFQQESKLLAGAYTLSSENRAFITSGDEWGY